jgi:hypothetical protein
MAKIFEKLIFGGLHEKHAVQRGIWVPTQHLLLEGGRDIPRGTGFPFRRLLRLAGLRWRYFNPPPNLKGTLYNEQLMLINLRYLTTSGTYLKD